MFIGWGVVGKVKSFGGQSLSELLETRTYNSSSSTRASLPQGEQANTWLHLTTPDWIKALDVQAEQDSDSAAQYQDLSLLQVKFWAPLKLSQPTQVACFTIRLMLSFFYFTENKEPKLRIRSAAMQAQPGPTSSAAGFSLAQHAVKLTLQQRSWLVLSPSSASVWVRLLGFWTGIKDKICKRAKCID